MSTTPQQAAQRIRSEIAMWANVITKPTSSRTRYVGEMAFRSGEVTSQVLDPAFYELTLAARRWYVPVLGLEPFGESACGTCLRKSGHREDCQDAREAAVKTQSRIRQALLLSGAADCVSVYAVGVAIAALVR